MDTDSEGRAVVERQIAGTEAVLVFEVADGLERFAREIVLEEVVLFNDFVSGLVGEGVLENVKSVFDGEVVG